MQNLSHRTSSASGINVMLAFILLICSHSYAMAQDSLKVMRPVTSSYAIEIGASHIADTYLTPLHYRGLHAAFQYERDQAMGFDPDNFIMQLKFGLIFDSAENPAKNATMNDIALDAKWAMMHRWRMPAGFTLGVGPGIGLNAGVLYLNINGNNPASAKVGLTLDATGYASWTGKVWKIPMTVRYQPTLPLCGTFFSPEYGELYYQIYLGMSEKLMHFAWPGNYFNMDNLLTADLHFGSTSLRIGYHNRIFSSKANNIISQNIVHAFVLGITTEWISLRPSDKTIQARILNAY